MTERLISLALGILITAVALWFLVTPEVARQLGVVVETANWWLLALALALSALMQWLRAWRFAIMTNGVLAFPRPRLVQIAFQLNFFNYLLPFRLGEVSYPVLMRRSFGQPLMQAAGVLLLARLFDLLVVAAILVGAAAALGLAAHSAQTWLLWAVAGALVCGVFVLALSAGNVARALAHLPLIGGIATPVASGLSALVTPSARFAAIAVSFAIWLLSGILAAVTALAVTTAVTPGVALLGASAGNLAFALPINGIGGLGPSQAAWVYAVTQAGVAWDAAVITALALYAVTFVNAIVLGGLVMAANRRPAEAQ